MMLAGTLAPGGSLPAGEAGRVRLAANPQTPAGVLRLLADDPAVVVRAAVAMNPAFAPEVHEHLLADTDERVRVMLANKLAHLLPSLSRQERSEALGHAHDTLLVLARDAATRVRHTLSSILHAMPEAPREVIMRLAQDEHILVSGPVLRLSPLLTDADLLELLASPAHAEAAQAVAGRVGLSETVSAAIVAASDRKAIHALLLNTSAMIQEGTLDALVGRAGDHPEWHEPLVQRPVLPERAARALSVMVAGHLLEALLRRPDLPAGLAEELRASLMPGSEADDAGLMQAMLKRHQATPLGEAALDGAKGSPRMMAAVVAVAAGIGLDQVQQAARLRNAKGLVSMVWRAGFSMEAAMLVQAVLGPFKPGHALVPTPDGGFPLSTAEMEWQLALLAEPGA